jgi:hypothetical protein
MVLYVFMMIPRDVAGSREKFKLRCKDSGAQHGEESGWWGVREIAAVIDGGVAVFEGFMILQSC